MMSNHDNINNGCTNTSWPHEVLKKYERIRWLGQGSFGGVWLAKSKNTQSNIAKNYNNEKEVAIKFIDVSSKTAQSYAAREIAILSEINHPNCIQLIESFDSNNNNAKCLVLTLARGPTIDNLLKIGGALGLPLAKLISRQLIEVVAYLHSHAVIHRDLKPDNCVLNGGCTSDDDIWSDDGINAEKKIKENKWKLILIDFGFARALHPNELQQHDDNNNNKEIPAVSLNLPLDPTIRSSNSWSKHGISNSLRKKKSKKKRAEGVLNTSWDKNVLEMSAIGSAAYAAPEVYRGARKNNNKSLNSSNFGNSYRNHTPTSLAPCVADYSMSVDSFSLGCTLRHIYTGVPPNVSVEEYISMQNNPIVLIIKYLLYCVNNKKSNNKSKRTQRIRYNDEVPKDMAAIISGLTATNLQSRSSVRACFRRLLPVLDDDEVTKQQVVPFNLDVITFFECSKSKDATCRKKSILICMESSDENGSILVEGEILPQHSS